LTADPNVTGNGFNGAIQLVVGAGLDSNSPAPVNSGIRPIRPHLDNNSPSY